MFNSSCLNLNKICKIVDEESVPRNILKYEKIQPGEPMVIEEGIEEKLRNKNEFSKLCEIKEHEISIEISYTQLEYSTIKVQELFQSILKRIA